MNINYTFHNIEFEWDGKKAGANLRKHNISFEVACETFFDPFVYYVDDEILAGEFRESIIGFNTFAKIG